MFVSLLPVGSFVRSSPGASYKLPNSQNPNKSTQMSEGDQIRHFMWDLTRAHGCYLNSREIPCCCWHQTILGLPLIQSLNLNLLYTSPDREWKMTSDGLLINTETLEARVWLLTMYLNASLPTTSDWFVLINSSISDHVSESHWSSLTSHCAFIRFSW